MTCTAAFFVRIHQSSFAGGFLSFSVASAHQCVLTGCQREQRGSLISCLVLNAHTQIHQQTHTHILKQWLFCSVSLHLKSCVCSWRHCAPPSCLQSVLSCPPFTSSLQSFSSSQVLPLPSWFKTLSASLPTSRQGSYFTRFTLLFPCHFCLSLCPPVYQFSEADQASLRDPSFPSFQTGLVSPAVRLASERCPSLPPASGIGH